MTTHEPDPKPIWAHCPGKRHFWICGWLPMRQIELLTMASQMQCPSCERHGCLSKQDRGILMEHIGRVQ